MEKVTISLIKADIGSLAGHGRGSEDVLNVAKDLLEKAKAEQKIIDFFVYYVGDDLQLLMTHRKFIEDPEIHKLAFDIFLKCSEIAKELKLYGAGQDILSTAFSGNLKGLGPGFAEMCIEERKSEPIIAFSADKTEPGAWNYYLFKIFADPFNTPGLVIDPKLHSGFIFEIHDVYEHKKARFSMPEEMYDALVYLGAPARFVVKSVFKKDNMEIAAVSSVERLSLIAGRYVGKDDPVLLVRAQERFPSVGEILEPFANPIFVAGGMRGSHYVPLMPVSLKDAHPTRFDAPARVVALAFNLKNGYLSKPVDLFDDPAFDRAREIANEMMDIIRKHGPFEPHRLPLDEMEYTTLPLVEEKLRNRWEKL